MRFTNGTGLPANWTMGFQRDGRELLVVVVKATYAMPEPGAEAVLGAEQSALVEADQFTAAPGTSAPLYETDYAHVKPACDVLLIGSAHAPPGRAVRRTVVRLRVGERVKQFAAVGDRHWRRTFGRVTASDPEPFERVGLTYDLAFGGTDDTEQAEGRADTCDSNPVGRGFWRHADRIEGRPLPNTEELDRPVSDPQGRYVPMAFSPVGRSWMPRRLYAGTYDDQWIRTTAPLWPSDFDERYFQAAPADQTIPYPQGGEEIELRNLTPDGHRVFRLPQVAMPVRFIPHRGRDISRPARLDTIVLEPDRQRFTLTWRVSLALGRSVFDVKETLIGDERRVSRERRFPGKTYYRSLAEAVSARRGSR
ncbi:DUF2169 domain-containing protein [Piscinibacter sp. XHJ-5]|uniref:DUF2169 family type VI secretion system accessory protein n=1 Tax=Piscinibacter sp. XHJ-5 TaxID=3037797 RepID=UPI002452BBB1|nr:DUF2169 domain-containing protein [Piscinibacter sp. XHJ-5]